MLYTKYETARVSNAFSYFAGASYSAYMKLAGIGYRELNLSPEANIEMYRRGRPLFRELYGGKVRQAGVGTPQIAYGHVSCLGSHLIFPETGEVGQKPVYASLSEGIAALQKPVDFRRAGMTPFYLDFRDKLRAAFPDEPVSFAFGYQGPITTAYLLRGSDFFIDLMDEPELTKRFLQLVTASINAYNAFLWEENGVQGPLPAAGMCDDMAALVPPYLWEEFVVPYWKQRYDFMVVPNGRRNVHCEDLTRRHLPYLERAGIDEFDPSVSPRLHPRIIAETCRVPFEWRLISFHYPAMDIELCRDFVFCSAADGACNTHTYVEGNMLDDGCAAKVHAFLSAGERVVSLLKSGASREEIGRLASERGRRTLFNNWIGFRGE